MRNEEALAQHTLDMGFDGKRFHGVDTKRVAPAIVFLHGNSSRWQHWLPQLRFFAKAYRVVAFDQLGFGASSPLPADYSMANQCEDTLRLLAELGIDDAMSSGYRWAPPARR
jgi:pimeloyl-ACP methyl ester carboxylesterase